MNLFCTWFSCNPGNEPKINNFERFFKLCSNDSFARTLYYHHVPSYYTWNKSSKNWTRRKRVSPVEGNSVTRFDSTLARVYTVHANRRNCFYLRMLLHEVQCPVSFEDLPRVDGIVYTTYREACDKEYCLRILVGCNTITGFSVLYCKKYWISFSYLYL